MKKLTTASDYVADAAPRAVITQVIESKGWPVDEEESGDNLVGFHLPNHLRSFCEAKATYHPAIGLLTVTANCTEGRLNDLLIPGMLDFCNAFNLEVPGVLYTFDRGDDTDYIEIEVSHWATTLEGIEPHLEAMLTYIEAVLKASLPAIMTYVSQKPYVEFDEDGSVLSSRLKVEPAACVAMMKWGSYGTA